MAVSALQQFAKQVQGRMPNVDAVVPKGLFQERGTLLHTTRKSVEEICEHLCVRIVDKGAGELWSFCRSWLWRKTEEFLRAEKYITSRSTPQQVIAERKP